MSLPFSSRPKACVAMSERKISTLAVIFTSRRPMLLICPAPSTMFLIMVIASIFGQPLIISLVTLLSPAMVRPPGYERLGRLTREISVMVAGNSNMLIGEVSATRQFCSGVSFALMISNRGQVLASMLATVVLVTSSSRKNGSEPRGKELMGTAAPIETSCLVSLPSIIFSASVMTWKLKLLSRLISLRSISESRSA